MVEAMIALGLIAIVGMVLSSLMKSMLTGQTHVNLSGEKTSIKNSIEATIDCGKTALNNPTLTTATTAANINLYRADGSLLVSNDSDNPTTIGHWTLRAYPVSSANNAAAPVSTYGIEVEVARIKHSGSGILNSSTAADFAVDPFTNQLGIWSIKSSHLFPDSARPCQSLFTSTSTSNVRQNWAILTPQFIVTGGVTLWEPGAGADSRICSALGQAAGVTRIHYYGTVACPAGFTAVGGGAECEGSGPGAAGGTSAVSMPVANSTNTWFVDCCVYQLNNTAAQPIHGYVNCMKTPN